MIKILQNHDPDQDPSRLGEVKPQYLQIFNPDHKNNKYQENKNSEFCNLKNKQER